MDAMAISDRTIVLASRSPRRRQLVAGMGFAVRYVDIDVEEKVPEGVTVAEIPLHLAKLKAESFRGVLGENELLVTADTVVAVDDTVLGKPHDAVDASRMLRLLSGRCHSVYTGVCVKNNSRCISFVERTDVYFRDLSDDVICRYVSQGSCMDKAGAYCIQEWIGMVGVERIDGCYYNVVGLPVARLYDAVIHF